MSNPVDLTVKVSADTADAAAGFDQVAQSAKEMGSAVERAGADAEAGASKLDSATASTDNLASKSSVATGALGALASGFELVGLEDYSEKLQQASMATDFLSGVGDSLTLVLESQGVQTALLKAKQIALTVATQAQAAAQWLLNAAMSANPIMLVVIAAVALTVAFIVLWKKSETFRTAVEDLGETVRTVFGNVKGYVQDGIEKLGDLIRKIGDVFAKFAELPGKVFDAVTGAKGWLSDLMSKVGDVINKVGDLFAKIGDLPGKVRDAVAGAKGWADELITKVGDVINKIGDLFAKIAELPGKVQSAVTDAVAWIGKLVAPFDDVLQKVKDLIDWISKIKIPHINLPGGKSVSGAAAAPFGVGATAGATTTAGPGTLVVNIFGAVDPEGTARQVERLQSRHLRRVGRAGLRTG